MAKKTETKITNRQGISDTEERRKALAEAISQVEKKHGKGTVMVLGDAPVQKIPVISTGITSLDAALGVGGVPRGRIIEIFGPEASGKTTMCLQIIAEAQKAGGTAAFIDAEHALDLNLAKGIGVDINSLVLSQPDSGEQALDVAEMFARSHAMDVIVIDSVAALTPKSEIEGEIGDPSMGSQARLMGQAMRKLTHVVGLSQTVLIFVNQLRQKIGVMFGNPETTPGGNALKFYASVRLDTRRVEAIKGANKDQVVGSRTKIKVVKNKVAPPFRQATVDIIFGRGVSREKDLLDTAEIEGVIQKSGTWYAFENVRLGQGREEAAVFLQKDPILFERIRELVLQKLMQTPEISS